MSGHVHDSTQVRKCAKIWTVKVKGERSIAVCNTPHRYWNLRAIWDHTVLPATRQRWHSRPYPSRSWYSAILTTRHNIVLSTRSSHYDSGCSVVADDWCVWTGFWRAMGCRSRRIWSLSRAINMPPGCGHVVINHSYLNSANLFVEESRVVVRVSSYNGTELIFVELAASSLGNADLVLRRIRLSAISHGQSGRQRPTTNQQIVA